ncbi:LamG-like jellyroll fold domain-containing protein [Pseudoxanthomonas sp. GW2]|jgi:hypothetical protein|uniref:LamG-like jellyroll fold domain-containing protein n=1 Tax=Pseudoxanthomonas sp. GW2 TaxID=1211114 RepID=UPI000382E6F8|nr:LamG-like jellyroll fold domain-containing protein [Pseudoxanthomonas sp. GW2]
MILRRMMMAGASADPGLASKVVAWYEFDGDLLNSKNPANAAGLPRAMTVASGGGYTTGKHGQALQSARAQYSIGSTLAELGGFEASGGAMWSWFKPTSSSPRVLAAIARAQPAGETMWLDWVDGGIGGAYRDSAGEVQVTARISAPVNVWSFAGVSYDRATRVLSLFVNGEVRTLTKASNGTQAIVERFITLGSVYSGTQAGAEADGFAIAGGPLTTAEMSWLYNGGAGRTYADLAA